MSDNIKKIEYDGELPPRESEAIDRLLSETAAFDDSEVDYSAMLGRIKQKAAEEGILIMPKAKVKKKRPDLVKRIFAGFSAAAAIFVLGFAVLTATNVISPFAKTAPQQNAYAPDKHTGNEAALFTQTVLRTDFLPDTEKPTGGPSSSNDASKNTPIPVTEDPAVTEHSPAPTEFATKGGTSGYVSLPSMEAAPAKAEELVPDELPSCMQSRSDSKSLSAEAYGRDGARQYSYKCTVVENKDPGIPVGVAIYTNCEDGRLTYMWRITEGSCLEVVFEGFTMAEAKDLLYSLAEEAAQKDQ